MQIKSSESNWLMATEQIWKVYVAILGFTGTLLCFLAGGYLLVVGAEHFTALAACGLFLGLATFVWMVNVVRCPHCHAKLVWTMAKSRPHSSWLVELAALEICPSCQTSLIPQRRTRGKFR